MSCDCRKKITAEVHGLLIRKYPEAQKAATDLTGYTFVQVDNKLVTRGYMEATFTGTFPLKAPGRTRVRKITQIMIFTYCPFCGTKYEDDLK